MMCCDKKEPRGCEISSENLGQSGDSQVDSGKERESTSGRRNSIFNDRGEGECKMQSGSVLLKWAVSRKTVAREDFGKAGRGQGTKN